MREHKKSHIGMISWGMFLAGALSLGSCSSDETLDAMEPKAITFGSVTMENHSRAADPSYGDNKLIDGFQVWGTVKGNTNNTIQIFDGATVTRGNAAYGEVWTQADGQTQYWISGADYEFLAIVDGTKDNVTSIATKDEYGMPTSISYTADGETDLLCQKVSRPQNSDESVVAFTFTHLLSKVHFTFISTSSLKPITVTDIQIAGHYASGTYTIANATPWGGQIKAESTQPLGFGNAEATITTTGVTSQLARLIIPGNDQTLTISFNQDNEKVEKELTHDFAPNTQYNIQITIEGGSEITFKIESLEAWGAEQVIDLNP